MENAEKMILIKESELNLDEKIEQILRLALVLAKKNAYNENFNLIINGKVFEDSNIIDYILQKKDDLEYFNDFKDIVSMKNEDKEPILYTNKSPLEYKDNKSKKVSWETY